MDSAWLASDFNRRFGDSAGLACLWLGCQCSGSENVKRCCVYWAGEHRWHDVIEAPECSTSCPKRECGPSEDLNGSRMPQRSRLIAGHHTLIQRRHLDEGVEPSNLAWCVRVSRLPVPLHCTSLPLAQPSPKGASIASVRLIPRTRPSCTSRSAGHHALTSPEHTGLGNFPGPTMVHQYGAQKQCRRNVQLIPASLSAHAAASTNSQRIEGLRLRLCLSTVENSWRHGSLPTETAQTFRLLTDRSPAAR